MDFCCFQLLILLDVIGHLEKHGTVVLAQTHVESSRVTVMDMKTVLEIFYAELIIVLTSIITWLIAVMNLVKQQQLQLLFHLAAEVHNTLTINGVMTKTTIQAAISMAELVVIITTVDGMTTAQ